MFNPPPPPGDKGPGMMMRNKDPEMESIRLKNFELRLKFFNELAKEQPKEEELSKLSDSLIFTQNQIEKKIAQHFISSRKKMSKEEAKEFFTRLTEHAKYGCNRIKEKQKRRQK